MLWCIIKYAWCKVSIATDTEEQLQYYVSIIVNYINDNATQFYIPYRWLKWLKLMFLWRLFSTKRNLNKKFWSKNIKLAIELNNKFLPAKTSLS